MAPLDFVCVCAAVTSTYQKYDYPLLKGGVGGGAWEQSFHPPSHKSNNVHLFGMPEQCCCLAFAATVPLGC